MHKIFIYDQENHVCIVACLAFTNASKEETKKEMHDNYLCKKALSKSPQSCV
jgi:hypothetical protein